MVDTPARRAGSPRPQKRAAPDEPRGACHEAIEIFSELRQRELLRIHLPRTPVNEGKRKGRGCSNTRLVYKRRAPPGSVV